jgi:hypothetical protein
MQVKETRVGRGVSPFIIKPGTSPIMSPIMKTGPSPFITKADASPIPSPIVIELTWGGVHHQDQLERFSVKREHNQHT